MYRLANLADLQEFSDFDDFDEISFGSGEPGGPILIESVPTPG